MACSKGLVVLATAALVVACGLSSRSGWLYWSKIGIIDFAAQPAPLHDAPAALRDAPTTLRDAHLQIAILQRQLQQKITVRLG